MGPSRKRSSTLRAWVSPPTAGSLASCTRPSDFSDGNRPFASFDGSGEVHRAERRRSGHQDERTIGRHDLLVSVISHEELRGGKVVGLTEFLHAIFEGVGKRDDFRFDAKDFAGGDELTEGAGTATAATD